METTKEDSIPRSLIVDREGDVIFLLKGLEVQVSSKVLGLASPVFKAMFGPSFAERSSLSSSSPSRITLTDDDPVAMVNLFKIIHYHTKSLPKEPDQSFLEQLAIVADKYDCIEALRPSSHLWLVSLKTEPAALIEDGASSSIGKLLYSAYTFDCAIAFKKITRTMIFHIGAKPLSEPLGPYQISPAIQALLPDGLLEALKSEENNTKAHLRTEVEQMMSLLVSDWDVHTGDLSKECMSIKLLLKWMRQAGLWPLSHALSSRTIIQLASRLTGYPITVQHTSYPHVCPLCRDRMAGQIQRLAFVMGTSTRGLCLDCFKRGGSGKKGGDCRVKHV